MSASHWAVNARSSRRTAHRWTRFPRSSRVLASCWILAETYDLVDETADATRCAVCCGVEMMLAGVHSWEDLLKQNPELASERDAARARVDELREALDEIVALEPVFLAPCPECSELREYDADGMLLAYPECSECGSTGKVPCSNSVEVAQTIARAALGEVTQDG